MSESTTPDLVGLMRRLAEAANEWDFDTADSYYAPDAVALCTVPSPVDKQTPPSHTRHRCQAC